MGYGDQAEHPIAGGIRNRERVPSASWSPRWRSRHRDPLVALVENDAGGHQGRYVTLPYRSAGERRSAWPV